MVNTRHPITVLSKRQWLIAYLKRYVLNWLVLVPWGFTLWIAAVPKFPFWTPFVLSGSIASVIAARYGEIWLYRKLTRILHYMVLPTLVNFILFFIFTPTMVKLPCPTLLFVGINFICGWLFMHLCRGIRYIRRQRQRRRRTYHA